MSLERFSKAYSDVLYGWVFSVIVESDPSLNLSSHSCVTGQLTEKEKLEQNYLCYMKRTHNIVIQVLVLLY